MPSPTTLNTRQGQLTLPLYLPTLALGSRFPVDRALEHHLTRAITPAVMLTQRYIQLKSAQLDKQCLWLDSGAYALLAVPSATWSLSADGLAQIHLPPCDQKEGGCNTLHPKLILETQMAIAAVGFTLDIPIPPACPAPEAQKRRAATLKNAVWALEHCHDPDLKLFAVLNAVSAAQVTEDVQRYRQLQRQGRRFDGIALGGLVPKLEDVPWLEAVVKAARLAAQDLPLHLFGVGEPAVCRRLYEAGASSTDSSSFVTQAVRGRWYDHDKRLTEPSRHEKVHLALMNLVSGQQAAQPKQANAAPRATWFMSQAFIS